MPESTPQHRIWVRAVLISIGVAILAYCSVRAYSLSFIHDESTTYLNFVRGSLGFSNAAGAAANNHLLNTLVMKAVATISESSEFLFRLPNLLALCLYLWFAGRFSRMLSSSIAVISCFILLSSNIFILDFFSLARGYGIALGCFMAALYYGILHFSRPGKDGIRSALFLALTVMASLTFLNSCILLLVALWLPYYTKRIKPGVTEIIVIGLIPLAMFTGAIFLLTEFLQSGNLYLGGKSGIWDNTIASILLCVLYGANAASTLPLLQGLFVALIVLAIGTLILVLAQKNNRNKSVGLILILYVFLGSIAAVMVQKFLFGTPLPVERTAMVLIQLLLLLFLMLYYFWEDRVKYLFLVPAALAFVALSHFLWRGNFTSTLNWKSDQYTNSMMQALDDFLVGKSPKAKNNFTIASHFGREPSINYYRITNKQQRLSQALKLKPYDVQANFYYVEKGFDENNSSYQLKEVWASADSSMILFERELDLNTLLIEHIDFENGGDINSVIVENRSSQGKKSCLTSSKSVFCGVFNYTLSNLVYTEPVLVSITASLWAEEFPTADGFVATWIVNEETTEWQVNSMSREPFKPGEWNRINSVFAMPVPPSEISVLRTYYLNNSDVPVFVDDIEIRVLTSPGNMEKNQ